MNEERELAHFQACFDDPAKYVGNYRVRHRYRRWLGDRFPEWHQRAEVAARGKGGSAPDLFEQDWHPGGVSGWMAERRGEIIQREMRSIVQAAELESAREGWIAGWLNGYARGRTGEDGATWDACETLLPRPAAEEVRQRAEASWECVKDAFLTALRRGAASDLAEEGEAS